MGLITAALESKNLPPLSSSVQTHDAALKASSELVRHTLDDGLIQRIVGAALPPDYSGNTLTELPGMIASAREKGFAAQSGDSTMVQLVLRYVEVAGITLFRDHRERAFMSVPQPGGAILNYQLGTKRAKAVLGRLFHEQRGRPLPSKQLKEALDALEAMAAFQGEKCDVFLRAARTPGAIYIDLGRDDGRVVEITAEGWHMADLCPVKFERRAGFGELPAPAEGGSVRALQELLQLDENTFILVIAFLLNCLRHGSAYMCLFVEGEQGSGKSFLCEILKRIIDPNAPLRFRLPGDERNLMVQANSYFLPVFDNVSGMKGDMSDALCTLSTGGGFATRQLYTNDEVAIIDVTRPFIINGIGDFAHRPDLMERGIPVKLAAMKPENRRTEDQLRAEFMAMLPGLLGALYDIVAAALRNGPSVALDRPIRMADCAKWLMAAEPATGFPSGIILPLIERAQTEMVIDQVVDLPLTMALRKLLLGGPAEGTVGEIFAQLIIDRPKGDYAFPATPAHLSKQLKRLKPALEKADICLEFGPHRREGKLIKIWRKDQAEGTFRNVAEF